MVAAEILGLAPWEAVLAVVIVFIGSATQASIGIGLGLMAAPTLSLIDPVLAPVPQVLMVLPLTMLMAWRERAHADMRGVPWVLAGRLPGALIGLGLLSIASDRTLDIAIAVLVLAGVAIRASSIQIKRNAGTEVLVGTFAGTASMVASIGGPPMALLFQRERAETIRATLGVVFTVGVVVTIVGRAVSGLVTADDVAVAALLFPAMVAGYLISIPLASRVSEAFVRNGILVVSTVAAAGLIVRAI